MDDQAARTKLGAYLVLGSIIAIVVLSSTVIISAALIDAKSSKESAQVLMSSLLPLFGTWVGTVLAFYFSKENFEAATKSTVDLVRLVGQRLSTTRAVDKMIKRVDIVALSLPTGKTLREVAISDVEAAFKQKVGGKTISRLVILDSNGACTAILHYSLFNEMLRKASAPVDEAKDDLSNLIQAAYDSSFGNTYEDFICKAIGYVGADKSMADAKAAMEQLASCQDVIVTSTGKASESVLGWLTNIEVLLASQP